MVEKSIAKKRKELNRLAERISNCHSKSEYRRLMAQLDDILGIEVEDYDERDDGENQPTPEV